MAGWPARAQQEEEEGLDQLAVASSLQEAVQELPASPLALLLATAAGGAAPVLPLAPQHFRQGVRVDRRFNPGFLGGVGGGGGTGRGLLNPNYHRLLFILNRYW